MKNLSGLLRGTLATASLLFGAAALQAQTVTYFHNDTSGSPVMATDAAGTLLWKESYRPYGSKYNNSADSNKNAIGFAGRPYDASSGLSYMEARYYDPVLGRFLGVDPAPLNPSSVHGLNRYTYANNNPVRYVDPDGHSPLDVAFLVWDLGKLGVAVYSGNPAAIGEAAGDVALSVIGVASPIPFAGQAIKAARAAEHAVEAVRGAETAFEVGKAAKGTVAVQRWMSKAELKATQETGLLRGGRDGTHYVTDAANADPLRARQRLALDRTPEVRATLEVPSNALSTPSRVNPKYNMLGGGMERTATGNVPARVIGVD
jgi:RHS repeat-associated protein